MWGIVLCVYNHSVDSLLALCTLRKAGVIRHLSLADCYLVFGCTETIAHFSLCQCRLFARRAPLEQTNVVRDIAVVVVSSLRLSTERETMSHSALCSIHEFVDCCKHWRLTTTRNRQILRSNLSQSELVHSQEWHVHAACKLIVQTIARWQAIGW